MKSSILLGLLSIVKLGLCVSSDGVPSGATFCLQFSTIRNDYYYLAHDLDFNIMPAAELQTQGLPSLILHDIHFFMKLVS